MMTYEFKYYRPIPRLYTNLENLEYRQRTSDFVYIDVFEVGPNRFGILWVIISLSLSHTHAHTHSLTLTVTITHTHSLSLSRTY
jgi:hypothetical protein